MTSVARSKRNLLSLSLLVLPLAGCTVGPDYVRPGVEVPEAFGESQGWKPAEPRDHEARGKWWEMFADAVLNGLQEQVNISNQTLMQAEANYRQAAALIQAADAANYPTLSGALGVTRSRTSSTTVAAPSATPTSRGVVRNDSLRLDAAWLPDFWGRVRRSVEASLANAQASAALVETARLAAQAQLAQSYFQLRVLDGQRRLYEQIIAAFGKALQITQNQYNAGVTAKADVIQAQAQLKTIQAQAIDLGVQRAQLEHAIAVLVGKPPAAFHIAPAAVKLSPPPIPPVLPSALLERRPDIATAERRVAAANAQIGVARAAFFPNVTLPASVGLQSARLAEWFTLPSRFWSIGPSLVETIFDAGLRRSQSDQAIAAYDASVAAYRQAVLVAFQQVEDNLAALRILAAEAAVQDEAVAASSMALELSLNQYRAGLISFLPVVVAQNNALANLRTQSTLLGLRMTASVQLVAALGGDWSTVALPAAEKLPAAAARTQRQAPQ
ncbi:MAG: RND transporter [Betaproteobacteria bacterium RIFCSPLOWO2_02_FULL_62_17]|nr:MAG: RND transporter [Betaproteobacteria bacterium RIFCSPLOWO2_02_FULL_62_17]